MALRIEGKHEMCHVRRSSAYLQSDQESDSLDGVVPTVHVVSHEQVVRVGRLASDTEQLHQVMELTVNVATNRHRAFYFLDVGLF